MNEQQIVKLWEQAAAAERREDWPAANRLYHTVANAFPMHAPTFLGRYHNSLEYDFIDARERYSGPRVLEARPFAVAIVLSLS